MSDEEISAGMKMFDIKPDYYVDDNYLFWAYDEESEDEFNEENWCFTCGNELEDCECDLEESEITGTSS